jgi:uncharacterized membrane protein
MQSHAISTGLPIHHILMVLAIGLLGTAVVFDLIDLATATGAFAIAAYWLISGGILGALLAAPFGLAGWLQVPVGTHARRIGVQHGAGNAVVLLLFAASWLLRDTQGVVPAAAIALSLGGAMVSVVTWRVGSKLVSRLGGVRHDDTGPDSSLSPAFEDSTVSLGVHELPPHAG